jgi:DNA-binding Lrp family transcriptional regulator
VVFRSLFVADVIALQLAPPLTRRVGTTSEAALTHAIVLIRAQREAIPNLGSALSEVAGVAEAYSVTGEWDFVAILRVAEHEQLAPLITGRLAQLPGIDRTYTMVAFEVFSQHDLEAMFSIGN